jgi:hypothetical protein
LLPSSYWLTTGVETITGSDKIAQNTLDKARKLVELIGTMLEFKGGN